MKISKVFQKHHLIHFVKYFISIRYTQIGWRGPAIKQIILNCCATLNNSLIASLQWSPSPHLTILKFIVIAINILYWIFSIFIRSWFSFWKNVCREMKVFPLMRLSYLFELTLPVGHALIPISFVLKFFV